MTDVGLYTISVRGLAVPDLLAWAAIEGIPFIHLRGGPRGYHLTSLDTGTVRGWRRIVADTVPITGVTSDIDLADVMRREPGACEKLVRLAELSAELGAGWVRLLARTPPTSGWTPRELPETAVPLLVEPHHPGWLVPEAFAMLPDVRLLADTRQLASGSPMPATAVERADVLHLSDDGEGLDPAAADLAAHRIAAGQRIEVAVEWTGPDRTPATCLARYRAAVSWWATREAL